MRRCRVAHDLLSGTTLRERATRAAGDAKLRGTLARVSDRFAGGREIAAAAIENWEELRTAARAVRARNIRRLPELLEQLTERVEALGGHVHFAADAGEATAIVAAVARESGARSAVKSKSMVTEEIGLNDALQRAGVEVVETDLGEWIIQLADELPSHILAPAIHRTREDVAELFRRAASGDVAAVPEELCAFARARLRERFLAADMGITGVNFAVASTGTTVLVTNEGNGRMVTSVPRVHVAVMGMERVLASWEELDLMLTLLPRAGTGQDTSVYVTISTGPRRPPEVDGPQELHLVVVDNGRSALLGGEYQEMLHCIRCGACLNVCPVYRQIGGHGYGWVYSGPMGAVLTPLLNAAHEAGELREASSLCGACWQACPVKIPLQDMLLSLRRDHARTAPRAQSIAWDAWAAAWSSPAAYRASTRLASGGSRLVPERMTPSRWSAGRTPPRAPEGPSFRRSPEGRDA